MKKTPTLSNTGRDSLSDAVDGSIRAMLRERTEHLKQLALVLGADLQERSDDAALHDLGKARPIRLFALETHLAELARLENDISLAMDVLTRAQAEPQQPRRPSRAYPQPAVRYLSPLLVHRSWEEERREDLQEVSMLLERIDNRARRLEREQAKRAAQAATNSSSDSAAAPGQDASPPR